MNKTTVEYANPKRKKPVTDTSGHYDIDGVTQAQDFEVIVAGDETFPNRPVSPRSFLGLKLRLKKWLSSWDD